MYLQRGSGVFRKTVVVFVLLGVGGALLSTDTDAIFRRHASTLIGILGVTCFLAATVVAARLYELINQQREDEERQDALLKLWLTMDRTNRTPLRIGYRSDVACDIGWSDADRSLLQRAMMSYVRQYGIDLVEAHCASPAALDVVLSISCHAYQDLMWSRCVYVAMRFHLPDEEGSPIAMLCIGHFRPKDTRRIAIHAMERLLPLIERIEASNDLWNRQILPRLSSSQSSI